MVSAKRFSKECFFYLVLASIFLAVYGMIRTILETGQNHVEFPYFSGNYWMALSVVIFVAGLIWINFLLIERFILDVIMDLGDEIDPDDGSGVVVFLLYSLVSGSSLSFLYWFLSPFASWVSILFLGPHEDLFSFYVRAWGGFSLVDSLALFFTSLLIAALEVLVPWLYQLLKNRHRPEFS
jgi:hypothetical protein